MQRVLRELDGEALMVPNVLEDNGFSIHLDLGEHFYTEIIEFANYTIHICVHFHNGGGDYIEYWKDEWVGIATIPSMGVDGYMDKEQLVGYVKPIAKKLLEVASRVLQRSVSWDWDKVEGRNWTEIVGWKIDV